MKEKFKKNSAKTKKIFSKLLIFLFVMILLIGVILLTVGMKNIIEIYKVNDDAKNVSDDVAKKSSPIIINNLLLGAVYNNTFVSSERFYFAGENKEGTKIDVYTNTGKKGTYELEQLTKDTSSSAVYITNTNSNKNDEYISIGTISKDIMPIPATETNILDEDYSKVKKALGIYKVFNPSVDIKKVYNIQIENGNKGKIYIVNSQIGKYFGGYSSVIYIRDNGDTSLLKYNYIANLNNSSDWPIYSFNFVADLNQDNKNEVIIQETREFSVSYDVLEYRNNKFVEVLSSEMKI